MIKFKQFRPAGIYIKDIREFTGYQDVVGACKRAGVVLLRLRQREYAPLSLKQTYKVLAVIRAAQGNRLLRNIEQDSKIQG